MSLLTGNAVDEYTASQSLDAFNELSYCLEVGDQFFVLGILQVQLEVDELAFKAIPHLLGTVADVRYTQKVEQLTVFSVLAATQQDVVQDDGRVVTRSCSEFAVDESC